MAGAGHLPTLLQQLEFEMKIAENRTDRATS